MKGKRPDGILGALVLLLFVSSAHAQGAQSDVYWRIDPGVETCSMVIDPSLTQGQWRRFVREASAIVTYKSLTSAETLGKMHFNVGITNSNTPVDQHDPAWINTFVHPDEDCPLGDAISIPTIRAAMGVSDNMDVGAYWTTAPGANYGLVGGQFKYAFMQASRKRPAASLRTSVTVLTGVPDFNVSIYSADLMTSRKVAMVTPYLGIKESLSIGKETTSKVDLATESMAITQGYIGAVSSIWKFSLAAEYDISFVNTFAFTAGFNF